MRSLKPKVPLRKAGLGPTRTAEPRVVFIGDSITFSWPELLDGDALVNRGVPGETTCGIRVRFHEQVLHSGAAGVNDIAGNDGEIPLDETRANLRAMAKLGRTAGLRVWLGSVLPVDGIFWAPEVTEPEA